MNITSLHKSEWIRSKDQKPECNVSVFVFIPAEDNHCTVGMWDISKKWVLLDEYRVPKSEVTYWHPMIELPEDKSYDPKYPVEKADEMDTTAEIIRKLQKRVYDLENVLTRLTTNPHVSLGDLVYTIRDREGEGWDGKYVKEWGESCAKAEDILKSK